MLKPKFKDSLLENSFNKNGYAVIENFLSSETTGVLKKIFHEECNYTEALQSMYFSNVGEPFEKTVIISDKIKETIENEVKKSFVDYRVELYTFIAKNPKQERYMHLHRDYSITHENVFEYRNVWIPLIDVNQNNGTIFLVPKTKIKEPISERWPIGNHSSHEAYSHYIDEILVLELKAGDALIYAEKTLHGSFNNNSPHTRPAIHFGLLHSELQFIKARQSQNGNIEFIETDFKGLLNKE